MYPQFLFQVRCLNSVLPESCLQRATAIVCKMQLAPSGAFCCDLPVVFKNL